MNRDEAHRKAAAVLEKEPKNVDALLLRAQLLSSEQKADEALAAVKVATAAEPRSAPAKSALATLLAARGQRE